MYKAKHKHYEITPIWVEQYGNDYLIKWTYHGNFQKPVFHVYLNGEKFKETESTHILLSGLKAGVAYDFNVLALSAIEAKENYSAMLYVVPRGNRLKINIPKVDLSEDQNRDFKSYLIYWSEDGSEPTTLLTELIGANNTSYTTHVLADGVTYKFRLKLQDQNGNTTDYGDTISGSVNTLPEAVTAQSLSYNQASRQVTVTATKPGAQDADVIGYNLYGNVHPIYGGLIEIDFNTPMAFFTATQTLSHITYPLLEGNYKFCFRAIDKSGLESTYEQIEINLVRSGSNIVLASQRPPKPYYIDALPIAGGKIKVTVRVDSSDDITSINVYANGALDGTITTDTKTEYNYTTGILTDNTEYSITATAVNGSVESEATNPVTAIADSLPPTGSTVLILEIVD